MKVAAIIPVAGSGKRFPGLTPKQFLEISGQPIVAMTIASILAVRQISQVVVVCAKNTRDQLTSITNIIQDFKQKGIVVEGGKERQDSVFNGLNVLDKDTDIVLVHDGVRPLISGHILEKSIQIANRDGACVAAVPVKDTIKRVKDNRVLETLNRDELWQIQTPQTARYDWLVKAHHTAKLQNYYTTDEAALLEWQGYPVNVISGDYTNIKITTPEDLKIAQLFFEETVH